MPAKRTPEVPSLMPRTLRLPKTIPTTQTSDRMAIAWAVGLVSWSWKIHCMGVAGDERAELGGFGRQREIDARVEVTVSRSDTATNRDWDRRRAFRTVPRGTRAPRFVADVPGRGRGAGELWRRGFFRRW